MANKKQKSKKVVVEKTTKPIKKAVVKEIKAKAEIKKTVEEKKPIKIIPQEPFEPVAIINIVPPIKEVIAEPIKEVVFEPVVVLEKKKGVINFLKKVFGFSNS